MKVQRVLGTILFVSVIAIDFAMANRLEQSAARSTSMLMTIGQATSIIGILLGGICMTLGMSQVGKMVLSGGLLGAICVFGAPAFIELIRGVFG